MFSYFKQYDNDIYHIKFSSRQHNLSLSNLRFTGSLSVFSLDDLKNVLNKSSVSPLSYIKGPYPIAVRHIHNDHVYVVERPPFQIKVDYSPTKSNMARRPIKPVQIWIPWTLTFYDLSSDQHRLMSNYAIYFNDGPLQSLDDVLLHSYTSNVYGNGRICLGATASALNQAFLDKKIDNLSTLHNMMFNDYFSGGWNCDLSSNVLYAITMLDNPLIINDYKNIDPNSEIGIRAKKSNIKFSRSYHDNYKTANFYYNLSLLTLEETLSLVSQLKNIDKNLYGTKIPLNKILEGYSNESFSEDIINSIEVANQKVALIDLMIKNPNSNIHIDSYQTRPIPFELHQFIKNNLDFTMDQVYDLYNKDKTTMITLNYELPLMANQGVSDEPF